MDSNSKCKENKIDASTRIRQNDESDKDDFSTVDSKKEVGEADSGRQHVCSEPKSGITDDYSGHFLPQTTVKCKGTHYNDMFGPCGIISPTNILRNLLSCFDPSNFRENECNAATVVPQLDSFDETEKNSLNILASVFSHSLGFKHTIPKLQEIRHLAAKGNKLQLPIKIGVLTEVHCITEVKIRENEGYR
ncbi:hypothetical protein ACTXT7_003046 [Hymenolepis weldensis]